MGLFDQPERRTSDGTGNSPEGASPDGPSPFIVGLYTRKNRSTGVRSPGRPVLLVAYLASVIEGAEAPSLAAGSLARVPQYLPVAECSIE